MRLSFKALFRSRAERRTWSHRGIPNSHRWRKHLAFAQQVGMQRTKARVVHRKACGLRHLIDEIVIAVRFRIGVGALNPQAFEVTLKENMDAGFWGNWSPALFRQMGRQLLSHPSKVTASGLISRACGLNKLIEVGRCRHKTGLLGGFIDQISRLQTIALVSESLRTPRRHQGTTAFRLCDLVDNCAHSAAFVYLVCQKLAPAMNETRHQSRPKRAISKPLYQERLVAWHLRRRRKILLH